MSNPHKCVFCDGSGYKDTGVGGLQPCLCQWKPAMTTTPKDLADAPEMPKPVGKVERMGSFRGEEVWGCLLTTEGQTATTYGEGLFTETQQEARDQQWQSRVNALRAALAASCVEERQMLWEATPGGGCERAIDAENEVVRLKAERQKDALEYLSLDGQAIELMSEVARLKAENEALLEKLSRMRHVQRK